MPHWALSTPTAVALLEQIRSATPQELNLLFDMHYGLTQTVADVDVDEAAVRIHERAGRALTTAVRKHCGDSVRRQEAPSLTTDIASNAILSYLLNDGNTDESTDEPQQQRDHVMLTFAWEQVFLSPSSSPEDKPRLAPQTLDELFPLVTPRGRRDPNRMKPKVGRRLNPRHPPRRASETHKTSSSTHDTDRAVTSYGQAIMYGVVWAASARLRLDYNTKHALGAFILYEALANTSGYPHLGPLGGVVSQCFAELDNPDKMLFLNEDMPRIPERDTLLSAVGNLLLGYEQQNPFGHKYDGRTPFTTLVQLHDADADTRHEMFRTIRTVLERRFQDVTGDGATQPAATQVAEIDLQHTNDLLAQLDELPGLTEVKLMLRQQVATIAVNQERTRRGFPTHRQNLHMVFTGEPGTGKTTVARLVGDIYKSLGLLSKGHTVEVDRGGLVGEYLGSTTKKTSDVVSRAVGGVLFIDEAYALIERGFSKGDAYGAEALNTLVKLMEDNRDDLVVIFAGYPQQMERFIATNPGLASRIAASIPFATYSPEELTQILTQMGREQKLMVSGEAVNVARKAFHRTDSATFGNARGVRNLLEAATRAHALRLHDSLAAASDDELMTLRTVDIKAALAELLPEDEGRDTTLGQYV